MKPSEKTNSKPKVDYGRIPDGTFMARVVQVVDLGQQTQYDWKTGEPKTYDDSDNIMIVPRVWVQYEFPTQRIDVEQEDGSTVSKPRWQGIEYTVSSHEKSNLYALMKACDLDPIEGDMKDLLGKALIVQIGSTSGGNAKVTNVMKLMDGMTVGDLENDTTFFDMDDPDMEVFNNLRPSFLPKKIKEAHNYNGFADTDGPAQSSASQKPDDFDDDIPF